MAMPGTLATGTGFWNPLVWLAAFAVVLAIALLLRSFGNRKHGKASEEPFFSGNAHPEEGVASGNIYWGFFKSLEGYYRWLRRMHTGIVNDYMYSYVLVTVILLAAVLLGGLLWA